MDFLNSNRGFGGAQATMTGGGMAGGLPENSMLGGFGGAALSNIFGNMFNNPGDIYAQGMQPGIDRVNQATDKSTSYLKPWHEAGQSGLNNYMDMLGGYKNPEEKYNNIMQGWKMSPGAQFQMNGAMDAIKNSMAARGMMGSGQEMKDLGQNYEGFAAQDQRNYLNDILGIGNTGLQGYGNLSQWGQNAGTNMGKFEMEGAGDIASMYNAIAAAQAKQAASENKSNDDMFGGLGSLAGGALGWL